ncbi:alpha/beta hydrolase [Paucisalibacillus sp. EB02]|uniref:alpha/beta hydrolase n=1 Tax=Paucisalibacillus sp. EB02 TaxID=1347087 RepID=UPI0004AE20A3|nr:alpha/beta hydrolase [Paucisalibacillus sp. EB02]
MKSTFWFKSKDNVEIYVEKWYEPDKKPKAIVQIAHGMVEHISRYNNFAQNLVDHDIFVFGNDHRGHGKTGEKQGLMGYFADEDGFYKTADDLYLLTTQIKNEYPNTPIFLLGHSMGSFLARLYIQEHSEEVDGVILSGTGFYTKSTITFGKMLSSKLPPKKKSPLMNKLSFGTFNRKIKNRKTNFDWLSGDEVVVQDYMSDPYTGFIPTARFFFDLMTGLEAIHNKDSNKTIRHDLPILLTSGDQDPVGNYGKGVWKVVKIFEEAGLSNVTTMLFENGHHELLNELNKEEVYEAINNWINSYLNKKTPSF